MEFLEKNFVNKKGNKPVYICDEEKKINSLKLLSKMFGS
jgi:hypothetical protein